MNNDTTDTALVACAFVGGFGFLAMYMRHLGRHERRRTARLARAIQRSRDLAFARDVFEELARYNAETAYEVTSWRRRIGACVAAGCVVAAFVAPGVVEAHSALLTCDHVSVTSYPNGTVIVLDGTTYVTGYGAGTINDNHLIRDLDGHVSHSINVSSPDYPYNHQTAPCVTPTTTTEVPPSTTIPPSTTLPVTTSAPATTTVPSIVATSAPDDSVPSSTEVAPVPTSPGSFETPSTPASSLPSVASPASPTSASVTTSSGSLPATGSDVTGWTLAAGVALAMGGALVGIREGWFEAAWRRVKKGR